MSHTLTQHCNNLGVEWVLAIRVTCYQRQKLLWKICLVTAICIVSEKISSAYWILILWLNCMPG